MTDGNWITCWKCNTTYFLPIALFTAAKASPSISFYCPYGHSAHYPDGLTETDKMRRRAERAEQNIEYHRNRAKQLERSVSAHKGQITKLKKRAKAGVCFCCNRTFQNLQRHMATKHADLDPDEPLRVIEGGKQ